MTALVLTVQSQRLMQNKQRNSKRSTAVAVLRKTWNTFQLAQPGMYSGSIYTRAGARIDKVGQEKTFVAGEWHKCKWCYSPWGLPFILSCTKYKMQKACRQNAVILTVNLIQLHDKHFHRLNSCFIWLFHWLKLGMLETKDQWGNGMVEKLALITGPVKEWQSLWSTFLWEVATMKAIHSDSHSFVHAVIAAQPLQSDMQFCSLTKMQNQQRTEK